MSVSTVAQPTLISAIWPAGRVQGRWRPILLAVLGSLLVAASAKVQVPFWPVPQTMQTFAVLVIGMAYGWRLGGATLLLYLAEGAVGLPVFAAGGGLAYFAGPTTGYLVGFVLAATLVGYLAERGWDRSFPGTLGAMTLGTGVIFVCGLLWLSNYLALAKSMDLGAALTAAVNAGLMPFLAGATAKIALASIIMPLCWRGLGRRRP